MRTFVPDQFKRKGHGWKKLTAKQKRQLAKFSKSATADPHYSIPQGQICGRY